jgi:hypothetical protein
MQKLIAMMATVGLLLGVSGAAHAAPKSRALLRGHSLWFGVDSEFGIPLGNASDANSVGGGVVVTGEFALLDVLSATARIGFEGHLDRTVGTTNLHVHAIPILLGTKYYIGADRSGIFGAFELGMFDLMSSSQRGTQAAITSNDLKFGLGVGLGLQQDRWSVRMNLHTRDVGNFGSAVMLTGGIGYQFAGI